MAQPAHASNPFEYQEPLLPDSPGALCLDRGGFVRQALHLLRRGGFLTVSAPPHSGVTSFLYTLRRNFPRAAHLDLANLSFADDPAREAAAVLARDLLKLRPGLELPAEPASVADVLSAFCKQTAAAPSHERLTVIVDGFDAWSDESARKLALALRAAYTEARNPGAGGPAFSIVTGSAVDLRDLTASGRTSPLNLAQHLFLTDFTEAEVDKILRMGLAGKASDDELTAWVRYTNHWTAGHPALVQMIGHKAFDLRDAGIDAAQAFERILPVVREEATDMLSSTLGLLAERPELRKPAGEIYSGSSVPFDRIHRPIRELYHMGLIRNDARGICKPRCPLFASVLTSALNLDATAPAAGLWDAEATGRFTRMPGEPTVEIRTGASSASLFDSPFDAHPNDSTVPPTPLSELRQRRERPPSARLPEPAGTMISAGTVLGGCRIEKRIGRGAMSEVYLARHLALDTDVAIKVLRQTGDDRRIAQRFLREARAAAQLRHEHIVQIRNVGREAEYRFIEMEYIGGGSLADLLKQSPYADLARAANMLRQAARGLQAAHTKGVIHRDIKPDNLMLGEDGKLKLVDFGLAAVLSLEESRLTQEGTILGTPHYMAPEQWEGNIADERSDLYSLGATFYHLLTGHPPFVGRTIVELISNFTSKELVPPEKLNKSVGRRLSKVIRRMLEKNPQDRYGSVADLLLDCKRL
ncbi:MAG: hypothetical protein AMXMBFR7_16010 [Planctomycetota bacterium]